MDTGSTFSKKKPGFGVPIRPTKNTWIRPDPDPQPWLKARYKRRERPFMMAFRSLELADTTHNAHIERQITFTMLHSRYQHIEKQVCQSPKLMIDL